MYKAQRAIFFCIMMGMLLALAACANNEAIMPAEAQADALQTNDAVVASASDDKEQTAPEQPSNEHTAAIDEGHNLHNLVTAHNKFGTLIFQHMLASDETADNTFLSPTSIALAISMALNGADGDTKKAMAEALQFEKFTIDEVNEASLALLQALTNDERADGEENDLGVQLNIANSIWHRYQFTLAEAFRNNNAQFYEAEITGLDFDDPSNVDTINSWVNDATKGLIPSVVDDLDPELIMMLINAVYFNGDWTVPFNENLTQDKPFHLLSGETENVPMMYRDGTIDYYASEDFEAVRLPYGEAEQLAMYVMLPKDEDDFVSFAGSLTHDTLQEMFSQFVPMQGTVTLPRMDISFRASLNNVLASLGMGEAFSPHQADFSNMLADNAGDNLYISDVIHQSALKVDEVGTEAAAVTSIEVRVTSMPMYEFQFVADRPFVIAIRDDATGALLFIGSIVNPTAS